MEYKPDPNANPMQDYKARMEKIKEIKTKYNGEKIIFTCSCFDLLHPSHLLMLETCRAQGGVVVVGLQTDPSVDRSDKNRPIQSYEGRYHMVSSLRQVDEIIQYSTEAELYELLMNLKPDIRVIGTDWKGKRFTGFDIENIKIVWHPRNETWSTSGLRKLIYEKEKEKNENAKLMN